MYNPRRSSEILEKALDANKVVQDVFIKISDTA